MSDTTPAPAAPTKNHIGLTKADYTGGKSTLCVGCGHDAITQNIINSFYELGVEPWKVAKLSGIGCSSKTPAYFLNQAHGFNTVHGRMPSVATGAGLANHHLIELAVSGDGDTASIGLGQFCHLVRRNLNMTYICENNGVYGLTKGQFSATADVGSKLKSGVVNEFEPVDICSLAIQLGAGFVARSFSGDPKQLQPLIKAALSFKGIAILDVISPCVTFNNHEESTKSYLNAKNRDVPIHELSFVPKFEQIMVDYEPGTVRMIEFPDGSKVSLKKLKEDYNPGDKMHALQVIEEGKQAGQLITGLLYYNDKRPTLTDTLHLTQTPLAHLDPKQIRPPKEALSEIMKSLM